MPRPEPIVPYRPHPTTESAAPAALSLSPAPSAEGGTVPLDGVAERRAAALPPPVRYRLKGVSFTLVSWHALPLTAWERMRGSDDPLTVLEAVAGPEKTREMAAAGFTLGDLEVVVEDWRSRHGASG